MLQNLRNSDPRERWRDLTVFLSYVRALKKRWRTASATACWRFCLNGNWWKFQQKRPNPPANLTSLAHLQGLCNLLDGYADRRAGWFTVTPELFGSSQKQLQSRGTSHKFLWLLPFNSSFWRFHVPWFSCPSWLWHCFFWTHNPTFLAYPYIYFFDTLCWMFSCDMCVYQSYIISHHC